ncbi:GH25 family lysozyme, partial [Acinetobacter sp. 163]|nr:GH25 family lysozyme [Acinetobacter sp. 163]
MSYQDPDVHTMTGIDVSSYQGKIDWKAVKEDGIEFVMIRCGFRDALTGELFDDPMFEENVEGA